MLRLRYYQWARRVQAERAKFLTEAAVAESRAARGPDDSGVRLALQVREPETSPSAPGSAHGASSEEPGGE